VKRGRDGKYSRGQDQRKNIARRIYLRKKISESNISIYSVCFMNSSIGSSNRPEKFRFYKNIRRREDILSFQIVTSK